MDKKIIVLYIIGILLFGCALYVSDPDRISAKALVSKDSFNQEAHNVVGGFGTNYARVDPQITLRIPPEQASEVYQYLRNVYSLNNELLNSNFPELNLTGRPSESIEQFTDMYFETPDFKMYNSLSTVRYRNRINIVDENAAKSGRKLVQMKLTPDGDFNLRTELKFPIEKKNKLKTPDDLHPLIGLIDENQREDFKDTLEKIFVNPYSLRYILTNSQIRHRVYIDLNGDEFISLSVDEGKSKILWTTAKISSVDIGLVETVYTEANESKREQMWDVRDFIIKDLQANFPDLVVEENDKYNLLVDQFSEKILKFKLLFKLQIIP